ncbi:MAG: hypothetical protein LHW57_00865, partial [Candidatus Cloacimonetes bacterium]|nr:hypothetical protein [Candidatus Cloacimonadota bacterium]
MRKRIRVGCWILLALMACLPLAAEASQRFVAIEDFESGSVDLLSWQDQDLDPSGWQLTNS